MTKTDKTEMVNLGGSDMKFYKYSYIIFIICNVLTSIFKIMNIESLPLMILNYIVLLIVLFAVITRKAEFKHLYLLPVSCLGMIFSLEYIPLIIGALVICLVQASGWKIKLGYGIGFALIIAVIVSSAIVKPMGGHIHYEKQQYPSPDRTSYFLRGYQDVCDGGQFIKVYKKIFPLTRKEIAVIHVAAMTAIHSTFSGNDAIRANNKMIELNNLEKAEELDGVSIVTDNGFMYKMREYITAVFCRNEGIYY